MTSRVPSTYFRVRATLLNFLPHRVDKFLTSHGPRSHLLQPLKNALQPAPTLVDGMLVHLDLAVREKLLTDRPKFLCKVEVGRDRGKLLGSELKSLPDGSVCQGGLVLNFIIDRLHLVPRDRQQGRVYSSSVAQGFDADLGAAALGDAVKG